MESHPDDYSQINKQFNTPSISLEISSYYDREQDVDDKFVQKWGFSLLELYKIALKFYKDKEGKAINFSYQDKLKLVALAKQISCGKFEPTAMAPLGVLDVIGRDRRKAWKLLGDMTTSEAMTAFIDIIDNKCTLFRPFIEAQKADLEHKRRKIEERESKKQAEFERKCLEEELKQKKAQEKLKEEIHKRQIQETLNHQTYPQFKTYVEQQYPRNTEKQEELLKQLQEQHYRQYMEQFMLNLCNKSEIQFVIDENKPLKTNSLLDCDKTKNDVNEELTHANKFIPIASVWTREDIESFKDEIRSEGDTMLVVGHGETVTIRVPTNDNGTCVFWEFATDHYDIGFGVFFEWTKSFSKEISVHISESENDDSDIGDENDEFSQADYFRSKDDDDDDDDDYAFKNGVNSFADDIECGIKPLEDSTNKPPVSVIIPVCRRESQEKVFAGSHTFPGEGVYILKFDNSYSLWRNKTLYYRVFYTR